MIEQGKLFQLTFEDNSKPQVPWFQLAWNLENAGEENSAKLEVSVDFEYSPPRYEIFEESCGLCLYKSACTLDELSEQTTSRATRNITNVPMYQDRVLQERHYPAAARWIIGYQVREAASFSFAVVRTLVITLSSTLLSPQGRFIPVLPITSSYVLESTSIPCQKNVTISSGKPVVKIVVVLRLLKKQQCAGGNSFILDSHKISSLPADFNIVGE
ncbi:hypothetical protein BGAL_0160g00010 [Botrytis galanthina]|uniref:Uncharacterized protein n=1 Tax=Botrytis galanthina TaxID=278940 RepID=A0A4S8QXW4_9HELO|nr:hypothetical protein BGAL_0160g00010 [Botrytis galanthina]